MKLIAAIALFILCMPSVLSAQTKNKLHFNNIDQIGFVTANKPNSVQFETINGVKYKTWSAGIGLGIDWQKARSVPLFLDVRKYFDNKKGSWFIYADAGKNIGWQNNTNADSYTRVDPYESTYFTEGGVGYLFKVSQKKHFFISAGYGYKNIQYGANYAYYLLSSYYPYNYDSYKINTYINRLIIKIGIQF